MPEPPLFPRSTRPGPRLGLALALLLMVLGTAPAVAAAEDAPRSQSALLVTRASTESVWEAPTLAPAPATTQQAQFDKEFLYVPIRRHAL